METPREMVDRVRAMADDKNETWDLSPKDTAALKHVMAERDWLLYFAQHADFGPADDDVRDGIKREYRKTGKDLPAGWRDED